MASTRPSVSVVDSLDTGTLFREEADRCRRRRRCSPTPRCSTSRSTTATGSRSRRGHRQGPHRVPSTLRSRAGCGRPGSRHGRRHHPLDSGRAPDGRRRTDRRPAGDATAEIGYPIVRDMDTFCYERQSSGSMEVGSYAHRPIFHHPDDIPSNDESPLSPTEMPLTMDDFDPQMEAGDRADGHARRRRDQVRHQRTAVADPRRHAVPRRDRRRCATCGRRPRCGSRRVPAWPKSSPNG